MPSPPPNDEDPDFQRDLDWMRRVQNGEVEAFRALVETHQNRVAGLIARMVGSQFDHSELAHEVFVKVWKSAARYQPSARFTTWLMTVTRNLVLNEFRYRNRHATVALESPSPEGPASFDPRDPSVQTPDTALQEAELQAAIETAIAQLPEQQRTALHLRRFEGLSYEEIAAVLDTSVSSVKSLLFRARTELREKLRDHLE
jgi:RNA polymerase sigma-70 factor (ECF subfamily)